MAMTSAATSDAVDDVRPAIEAPEPPRRVHRPLDFVRLLVALAGLAVALLVGVVTANTVAGIGEDVNAAIRPLPAALVLIMTAASGLMLLALPVAILIDLLFRRRFRMSAEALLVAVVTLLVTDVLRVVLVESDALASALIGNGAGDRPLNGFAAAVVAMATVTRLGHRQRWRVVVGTVFLLVSLALVAIGFTSLAIVVSLLIGRVVGLAVRWAAGSPPSRPSPRDVVRVLRRLDIDVVSFRPRQPDARDPALFDVRATDGRALVVYVLDHDHVGTGLLISVWRTVRVRQAAGWWTLLSLRRTLDQLALVGMAMPATG